MSFEVDMGQLHEFNGELLAELLGGRLREKTIKFIRLYVFHWGEIRIYDNGGEANVYFEYLREVKIDLPKGVSASEFSFGFSVPYEDQYGRVSDIEFAARLKFYLDRAATGVDDIDYFRQDKLPQPQPFMATLGEKAIPKIKCDLSKYPVLDGWEIFINLDYHFEVWHKNQTLYGTFKTFRGAMKSIGIQV